MRGWEQSLVVLIPLAFALFGCALWTSPPRPGPGEPISWAQLPYWEEGSQAEAWQALLRTCDRLEEEPWRSICAEAKLYPNPTNAQVRAFFQSHFVPRPVYNRQGGRSGLTTGYYEPLLQGSRQPSSRYRYPIYAPPSDLLHIDLGGRFPELQGEPVRGRLTPKGRVVPYYTRAQIEGPKSPLSGNELLWVSNPIDRFLLHIQGSGRVRLPSGKTLALDYADQNGRRYVSIGRILARRGELDGAEVTLPRIRRWLQVHSEQRRALLNRNPSYVFFQLRDRTPPAPIGTLGSPLTPHRSIAVDPDHIPLGAPIWLVTRLPATQGRDEGSAFRKLVFAQDTGGAIQGPVRADLFVGHGDSARRLAGRMRQEGQLYLLTPAWQFPKPASE